ncbi:14239_t:CDS:2 [Acaulospora morrowiae]|uniref:14239_t:CDS:1 n=1 Tax=Acaulospora morrowiae TaxID=94023 RepID=A0A9N9BHK3_9GLOM|nr:14239_t:CDS:2 [Acaulospora morrowiae]
MQLISACLKALRNIVSTDEHSLRVPIKTDDLGDKDTEHRRYKVELEIIKHHHGENSEIGAKVTSWLKQSKASVLVYLIGSMCAIPTTMLVATALSNIVCNLTKDDLRCIEQTQHVLDATRETRSQSFLLQQTITKRRLLDESRERNYKESGKKSTSTRHGRNIPYYCESDVEECLDSDLENLEESKNKNARSLVREHVMPNSSFSYTPNKPVEEYSARIICDFNMTIQLYLMPKVLDRDMLERSYIIECLSPILHAFRNAFPDVGRKRREINQRGKQHVYELSDARELLNVEVSGPCRFTKKHTVGDIKKLLVMAICSLCRLLGNNLDFNIKDAKDVKLIISRL